MNGDGRRNQIASQTGRRSGGSRRVRAPARDEKRGLAVGQPPLTGIAGFVRLLVQVRVPEDVQDLARRDRGPVVGVTGVEGEETEGADTELAGGHRAATAA